MNEADMSPDASLKAMLTASLPKGTKWFLVAAIPIDDALSVSPATETLGSSVAISGQSAPPQSDGVEQMKLDRLIDALQKDELNDSREVVVKSLLATPEGEWLPVSAMAAAIEKAGIAQGKDAMERSRAALGYLSWQIKAYMPQTDLIGSTVLDLLATRRKFGNETKYRVTQLGRAALAHIAKTN
jgi:hypothetical protein